RAKLGWVNVKKIDKPSINELRYNLSCPEIYWLEDQFTKKYLLIEYRKFAQEMKLGDLYVGDYNSFIGNIIPQDGLLIWKILDGGFIKLLHSCGNDCTNSNHHIFPGESCTSVITPWSANGECKYGSFWIPNTKPSNNIGLEILSSEFDHYCVGFYNSNPICTSPSKPINVNKGHEENIRVNWNKNLEPDVTFYKIYKKLNNSDYYLYDSTANNYYTDYKEINYVGSDTCNYVYYKITAIDAENKESTFSAEVKISVAPRIPTKIVATNKTNNKFILEQNYPNPFNPSTTIKYFLPEASKVNLAVYDVLGNQISMLVNKTQNAGNYEVEFNITDGENIASGLYLFRMSANIFVDVKKGIVLK
ncbi:MAG: T9SS type A sorting domain-containing protein, partial [Melioribacteraceae bacterium]|nr:T9SS type A sorting domain-containing protein [Melioribacteraceae bacterium]